MPDKRYYWLKLHKDFFKRHDIKIIEKQTNGKDYIIFYLKLLAESIDHDGELRFSDELPYDVEMLSIITDTNVDIVRSAVSAFATMGLMEKWDDGTYFMSKIEKMIGSESGSAGRVRRFRERKALLSNDDVTNSDKIVTTEYRVRDRVKSKSKKEEGGSAPKRFTPPTSEDIYKYGKGYSKEQGFPTFSKAEAESIFDHYKSNGWKIGGKAPMKDWESAVRNCIRRDAPKNTTKAKDIEEGHRRRERERKEIQAEKAGVDIPSMMDGIIATRATEEFKEATS